MATFASLLAVVAVSDSSLCSEVLLAVADTIEASLVESTAISMPMVRIRSINFLMESRNVS